MPFPLPDSSFFRPSFSCSFPLLFFVVGDGSNCARSLNGDTVRGEALQNSVGVPILECSFLRIEVTHHVQQTVSVHVFVLLYPEGNVHCAEVIKGYTGCLTTDQTFVTWTLESVAKAIKRHTDDEWIDLLIDRYLNFEKISSYAQRI